MRVGYPCINRSVQCTANSTFRLASYSPDRLIETLRRNLDCLGRILEYNVRAGFAFFRISSDLVPFASHPICQVDWVDRFRPQFQRLGATIRKHKMRISMHPDQFVLLNALNPEIVTKSLKDLEYHCDILDAMALDRSAKIQIHLGGVYGDRDASLKRFILCVDGLSQRIRRRLAIENDDRLYGLDDCLKVHKATQIPVIFDSFHHECLSSGQSLPEAMAAASRTWRRSDGPPMVDYSSQEKGKRTGSHAETLNVRFFKAFIAAVGDADFDLMLEIKDKEKSAQKALGILRTLGRIE